MKDRQSPESGEVPYEFWGHVEGNKVVDSPHSGGHAPTLDYIGGSFSEPYAEGGGVLHIHFRVVLPEGQVSARGRVSANYGVAFYRLPKDFKIGGLESLKVGGEEGDGVGLGNYCDVGQLVLVRIVKPGEVEERTILPLDCTVAAS